MKLLLISLLGMVAVQVSLHQRNLESFGEDFKTEFLSVARCCPIPNPWDERVQAGVAGDHADRAAGGGVGDVEGRARQDLRQAPVRQRGGDQPGGGLGRLEGII